MTHWFNGPEIMDRLKEWGFFDAPASTTHHGNYAGGLYDHSFTVASTLAKLTRDNGLVWQHERSPWVVGMFHDLCKCDQYRVDKSLFAKDGTPYYGYNTEMLLKGHGDKSLMRCASLLTLTEEEAMCIRYHMGAFTDKEEWSDYTRAIHKYPNVLWTHQADMIAAHVCGI